MTTTHCRWGILGAAFIARKNWQAIRDAGNATLVAVASRDLARAHSFIAECQASAPHATVPEAMDNYDALLARTDIDAVYIPLPTGLRKEWVIRAAEAGKHVLVEKPVGVNAEDVSEIIAACEKHRVQFMDGVMFMHGSRLKRLREVVDRDVGKIRHIATQFSFLSDEEFQRTNIRAHGTLEPLGCLGDLGWYCLRFTLWAMNYAVPAQVTGRILAETRQTADSPPVPLEFTGTLTYADGASASFYCSFTTTNAQWAVVSGSKGLLQLSDFVLPFSGPQTRFSLTRPNFVVDGCRADMHEGCAVETLDEPSNNAPGSQECGLFRTFSELVLSGKIDPHWPRISLLTQRVLDACLQSANQGSKVIDLGA
ncbi:MAG: Gfo/Idh/MocA family oxidoreductase [Prosthecobacter sp.]|uniref:Gfo/Idh/MocA family oxidoreductase n=1 Tax=Prosthecobacter sp. TaxID=1965333 RepID=UPI0019EB8CFE|nr:Gfo/Idh/MocA family oxidoreductase [Prosthecobacter sp.]MBE2283787.1 Gfo/Idh/MocA family oxidoreductase [Prosthecobacter sp.]